MRLQWNKLDRDERIAVIRVGVAKKMSAGDIAAEIDGCTRNMIIGLAHRADIQLVGSKGMKPQAKAEAPKTGLITRPLAPIRAVKAKRASKPSEPSKTAKQRVTFAFADWRHLSPEEKADHVRSCVDRGMTSGDIVKITPGATREGIKSCARRNGIQLIGNTTEKRRERSTKPRQKAVQAVKRTKPDWTVLTTEQRMALIRASITAGRNQAEIAERVENATEDAVRRFASRHGLVLPPKPVKRSPRLPVARREPVDILSLTSGMCRAPKWKDGPRKPIRDTSEWIFCGEPVQPGSSFCPTCHSRFWYTPDKKLRYDRRSMGGGYARP